MLTSVNDLTIQGESSTSLLWYLGSRKSERRHHQNGGSSGKRELGGIGGIFIFALVCFYFYSIETGWNSFCRPASASNSDSALRLKGVPSTLVRSRWVCAVFWNRCFLKVKFRRSGCQMDVWRDLRKWQTTHTEAGEGSESSAVQEPHVSGHQRLLRRGKGKVPGITDQRCSPVTSAL